MFSKKFFRESFFLVFIIAVLNLVALNRNLYWSVKEFDSLMHFLGGAWVALTFIFIYYFSGAFDPGEKTFRGFIYIAFLGTLFISVGWEIYELLAGATFVSETQYSYDTILDFIMDGLGAVAASMYAFSREVCDEKRKITYGNDKS